MNDNDAIEQAYRNGYDIGSKAGYDTGRRYGVCEFEAYLFIWACEHGDIKSVDLPKMRETYLELVERSAKK
jgi:hypothetical protein